MSILPIPPRCWCWCTAPRSHPTPSWCGGQRPSRLRRCPLARVERWMTHRAKQLGLTLTPEAGELLLASVGTDLSRLARELEKLAPLCADRPATRDEVAALVGVRRGETLQDFVDAALERRAAAAARLVEPVLEQAGMNGVRMLRALGTALVGTALARAE